jgi:hypothetical protein
VKKAWTALLDRQHQKPVGLIGQIIGRRMLRQLEMRTGRPILENGSIDSALDRFAAKVRSIAGDLEIETIEEALNRVGKELIDVATESRRRNDDSKRS